MARELTAAANWDCGVGDREFLAMPGPGTERQVKALTHSCRHSTDSHKNDLWEALQLRFAGFRKSGLTTYKLMIVVSVSLIGAQTACRMRRAFPGAAGTVC